MEEFLNADRSFKIACDNLLSNNGSTDIRKNLIIESSYNTIDFSGISIIFDGHVDFSKGSYRSIDISNVSEITTTFLTINSITLPENVKISYNSVNDGYIRNTSIGYNPIDRTIGRSDAYFTYINVSGDDSTFNNSIYVSKNLLVHKIVNISNSLLINGMEFSSIETSFNSIRNAIARNFYSDKILTIDASTTNVSISNNLYVLKTAYFNDISINGQLLNNVLKVPGLFTIDPSGYNNNSGTLIINGDLTVNGTQTSSASSSIDISDLAITLASKLSNIQALSNSNAGLDISNIASLKYNGTTWNFSGGLLNIGNKQVLLNDDLSLAKRNFDLSLISIITDFSSSFFRLKRNIDNSYNTTYTQSQIDSSFILRSAFDGSYSFLKNTYLDSSYISKRTFDGSFQDIITLMGVSYVARGSVGTPNSFDISFASFTEKLDTSYVLNSVFEASYNNIKTRFDISFASINTADIEVSSIIIETINTKHNTQKFNNNLWNIIGQDISTNQKDIDMIREASDRTITISGGYIIHSFTTVGTSAFVPAFSGPVEVLIVGGGGGGGSSSIGGGGGGGGVIYMPNVIVYSGISYEVVVGDGGIRNTNGNNSSVFGAIAAGGGAGGQLYTTRPNGSHGGSGGGAAGTQSSTMNKGGDSSGNSLGNNSGVIYGNSGGSHIAVRTSGYRGAGGGGAGSPGTIDIDPNYTGASSQYGPSSGGQGVLNNILGPDYYWGGGGGGGAYLQSVGWGGIGGGGGSGTIQSFREPVPGGGQALNSGTPGLYNASAIGGSGGANTGGGGGAGGISGEFYSRGGSGIVVIRYRLNNNKKVAISNDGNVVAMSSSNYYTVNDINVGRVYVYELSYNNWNSLGTNAIVGLSGDELGYSLALSSNGRIVAASSLYKDASAGQVRLFELSNNTNSWIQKGSNINGERPGSESGYSISLAGNGNRIAIGAWKDNSNGTNAGAVRVYDFSSSINDWRQQGQTIAGISGSFEGYVTALSLDGQTLASGSILTTISGTNVFISGLVKTFTISGTSWTSKGIINGPDISNSYFGRAIKLSGNGSAIVIGSPGSITNMGQAYVYGYTGTGTTWTQLGQSIQGISGGDEFGSNVSMSNDGTLISVGSNNNNYNRGHVRVFSYANNYWYQLSNSIDGKTATSKAGIHALSGDGTTLIQSNNTYNTVYGINKPLAFVPSTTTTTINTTISGDLAVTGKAYLKSFRISNRHNFDVSINGYSSHYLATSDISASIVDYYSNVGSIYNKVFKIDACGNVSNYTNEYGAVSDSRLKENIVNCSPKLEDMLKVRVVNYNLKGPDTSKYIGVVAQELEELFPELVAEDNTYERFKSVNYSNLTILLIKAFQEQQILINNLNTSLEELENSV